MNALFGSLTTDGLEEATDRLGGFSALPTDIYTGPVKLAYAGQSSGGARSVTVVVDLGGREYRETIYITNRKGENFYLTKNDKKAQLPGFIVINDLCLCTTGKPLSEQPTEEKQVMIYDPELKREVPTATHVLVDLIGKPVTLAIWNVLSNKSQSDGNGGYVDLPETRESNSIDKVFNTETMMTVPEAMAEAEEGTFHVQWLEKNKGKQKDERTIKDGQAAPNGGRQGAPGQPPQSGAAKPAGKSLFGNKKAA